MENSLRLYWLQDKNKDLKEIRQSGGRNYLP